MPNWLLEPCVTPDASIEAAAYARQASLTKPPGSLGALETAAIRLAALQRSSRPAVDKAWISIFAGDHGIAEEGVSAFPQAVTGEMLRNFAGGGAAISVLARELGATLEVVNLGTVNDPGEIAGVRRAIIASSTANFCRQPAMTVPQLQATLDAGAHSVATAQADGAQIFIGGEMGIANTTSASALGCALLGLPPASLCGAGTGLDAGGIAHKAQVIARALALHSGATTPLEQLRCLGGFEIAALAGAYVAAAQAGLPVLVDGFISTVAALVAVRINPACRDGLLFAHCSHEHGHARVLAALDAEPMLDLGLRLGEGSGAAIALPLLRLACALHNRMATFEQAGVSEA
ncbi:nicotinate-nucleotide--dimethylbenzimidazole phosphoribosyltransferase [Rhodanobacter sp. FW510-R12]|uniref:nicotinate-nucleotide--dimethylbenzimidazole phosphoribosyltransferase n=1 Tax=unclassified Rhodanobacter TaxID=2621553 RepID=UPI0007AA3598|nr:MULTISPECIES: nicotinate-nucleotide--dimethylbenzimidazole phosphoribosyltransferase [unclassified Rhodanobacter]KZC15887.1 nicotinate-nucleotide--dimethylbenzimidazole phosphoribosyltransferase [Rhodanobacter sp. FW104-R8]KZC28299.1 nicotinate-nucleotide--dimethylbenzimidazole phosphoribosyltransferase [Rhodanobacter sp. FW510-T8]KZC32674.1 nicotinate-nucleotide--dimethylbenzimidazole phosphoribosyltransferase [Rhodanobacter sp. FW510-R10]